MFRAAHSLKGAARAVNYGEIETVCQSLEDTYASWKREENVLSPPELDTAHRALDSVSRLIAAGEGSQGASVRTPPLARPQTPPLPEPLARQETFSRPVAAEKVSGETVRIAVTKLDARLLEAEEMLAAKLAAGQRTVELAELSAHLGAWAKEWTAIQPDLRSFRRASERPSPEAESLERLVEFFESSHDHLRLIEGKVAAFQRTAEQDRLTVGKLVDDLLEESKKLLMLPLATLGAFFPKVVRDLCRDQGKEADLVIRGEDVEIDKRILEEMKDPFIHLLRNCVGHGIEPPAERRRMGKPSRATITLVVSRVNGNKVEIVVADDGAGIDFEKVKAIGRPARRHHGR